MARQDMSVPKWYVIARNEYRIRTSRVRLLRPLFPYLVVALLAAYVAFIAPALVSVFVDEFVSLMLSRAAIAMVQIILFLVFIYFMIIPITDTLRDVQAGELEIFLSAPVKPSHVLIGDFLGEMIFYVIFITVVAGIFTAALRPLGLSLPQMGLVVVIFALVFLSASWVGTVIASVLRTRLGEGGKGQDIGKALSFLVALPIVFMIYAIQFGGLLQALSDPAASGAVRTLLGLLPSSWGAWVIAGFASEPGGLGALGPPAILRLAGLALFFLGSLWAGSKIADRCYSLEPATFTSSKAGSDGAFYRGVRSLVGGGSFGILFVSILKEYARRLENLSRLAYMLGVILIMGIFITRSQGAGDFRIAVPVMMIQFLLPILTVFVTGEVTLKGKEALFIVRKAPSGLGRFVRARLLHGWLLVVPITVAVALATTIPNPHTSVMSMLPNIVLLMVLAFGNVAFVLGLFLLSPAFSEKSGRFYLNMFVVIGFSVCCFIFSLGILAVPMEGADPVRGMLYLQASQTALTWLAGLVMLAAGRWNLARIE